MKEINSRIDELILKLGRVKIAIEELEELDLVKQTKDEIYQCWVVFGQPRLIKIQQSEKEFYLRQDGKGNLIGIIETKEYTYKGEISVESKKPHGIGEKIMRDGTRDRGEFANGKACGITS